MHLFVGHAESPWMPRLRLAASLLPWLIAGLASGALIDAVVSAWVG